MQIEATDKLPQIDMVKTGKNIERLCKMRGISVKNLQEYFGFSSPQAIYKWQWGKSLPSIDNLVILSHLFDTPIEQILCIDRPKPSGRKEYPKTRRASASTWTTWQKPISYTVSGQVMPFPDTRSDWRYQVVYKKPG